MGTEIKPGDRVGFIGQDGYGGVRKIRRGVVVKLTKKMVSVQGLTLRNHKVTFPSDIFPADVYLVSDPQPVAPERIVVIKHGKPWPELAEAHKHGLLLEYNNG